MKNLFKGNVWKFGDNVNTDLIHPPKYFSLDPERIKQGLMKGIDEEFVDKIKPGDIIVAGKNFGCGSSREVSAKSIKLNGISCIIAISFARIFFRNLTNNGILLIECDLVDNIENNETIEIDVKKGQIRTEKETFAFDPPNELVLSILQYGGLINKIKADPNV